MAKPLVGAVGCLQRRPVVARALTGVATSDSGRLRPRATARRQRRPATTHNIVTCTWAMAMADITFTLPPCLSM
ncbi:hypothetical protein B296_00017168 [Ensete ventricosum]|uniref:Uncharacterized protein n=1 Tax=Ensete ventricosum TaxID=4639 RepID=A0A427AP36_ENSVE|nr:hypothetical protein B296_00017168 [Ensete ventricosum]